MRQIISLVNYVNRSYFNFSLFESNGCNHVLITITVSGDLHELFNNLLKFLDIEIAYIVIIGQQWNGIFDIINVSNSELTMMNDRDFDPLMRIELFFFLNFGKNICACQPDDLIFSLVSSWMFGNLTRHSLIEIKHSFLSLNSWYFMTDQSMENFFQHLDLCLKIMIIRFGKFNVWIDNILLEFLDVSMSNHAQNKSKHPHCLILKRFIDDSSYLLL